MAQERPNRLAEWFLAARAQWPALKHQFLEWLTTAREEPSLIWQTAAVRYSVYVIGGLILLSITSKIPGWIGPPPVAGIRPEATSADFHVVCTDPTCGAHFVIHRKFGFSGFPVECLRCKKVTGFPARLCHSEVCKGRWVAPAETERGLACPRCGTLFTR